MRMKAREQAGQRRSFFPAGATLQTSQTAPSSAWVMKSHSLCLVALANKELRIVLLEDQGALTQTGRRRFRRRWNPMCERYAIACLSHHELRMSKASSEL